MLSGRMDAVVDCSNTFCVPFIPGGPKSGSPFLHATAYMLYAIARPSVTRVDQSKTVELRVMQFSPYSSPIPLVFGACFIQKF